MKHLVEYELEGSDAIIVEVDLPEGRGNGRRHIPHLRPKHLLLMLHSRANR